MMAVATRRADEPKNKQKTGKQLLWRCRRGTKELDLILSKFVENNYNALSKDEKNEFDNLLEVEDAVLTEWLCYKVKPTSQMHGQGMVKIVSRILSTYSH